MATISNSHARPAAFRRLLRGGSPGAAAGESQAIVRHLLAGCETCQRRMAEARAAVAGNPAAWSYDAVFSRLARPISEEREQETATARYAEHDQHL